jgi:RNA 3'-terminal phosphate cyclase (ATP)
MVQSAERGATVTTPIEVDAAMGEGGGQVLRSALSLSLLSGRASRLSRIRANQDRPGLRPQHLAAVRAAARVASAEVRGDRVGSEEIAFASGPVRPGDYFFDIGTAGSTSPVLRALLLPLALARKTSSVTIRGGTHVPWSPCFRYLDWQWRPPLAPIGVPFELTMTMAGFYPQGRGELQARIPGGSRPRPLSLPERGPLRTVRGLSAAANLPREIAVLVSINSDADDTLDFAGLTYGVGQARRGCLEAKDVLNTRRLRELLPLLRETM